LIHRVVLFCALAIVAALSAPGLLTGSGLSKSTARPVAFRSEKPESPTSSGRHIVLQADAGGHYTGRFALNGRAVDGLVDTGATFVSINRSTARRIGIDPAPSDFTHKVRTANGTVPVALVKLRQVTIGPIRLRDIDAVVLENDSLGNTLIGMSFLRRLKSWHVENGGLVLTR
jgi:aspartyl protease family protein